MSQSLADSPSIQVLLAESTIDVVCAYALGRQDLAFVVERGRREEPLTDLEIAGTRADQAYLARLAMRATNRLFEVSGAHGVFETSAFQRFHRDQCRVASGGLAHGIPVRRNMPSAGLRSHEFERSPRGPVALAATPRENPSAVQVAGPGYR